MKRARRRQYATTHVAQRKRYKSKQNGVKKGVFGRVLTGLETAARFVLSVILAPFVALGSLLRKKKTPPDDGAAGARPIVPGGSGGPQPKRAKPGLGFGGVALLTGVVLSAGFFCWASFWFDTAKNVSVNINGQIRHIKTTAQTVEELFSRNSITTLHDDILSHPLESELDDGMEIEVTSAFPVAVASKGEVTILQMHEGSVGEALALAGIDYDSDDEITRLTYEDVMPGMHIQHIEVVMEYETKQEVIEYKEEEIKDDSKYVGNDTIKVAGKDGEQRIVRRLVYKDGVLSSREIMNQIILKEAVDEVKVVGTKIRYQTKLTGDTRVWKAAPTDSEIKKTLVATEITAYTHTGRRTATGRWPRVGYVAVNPNVIPYGTRLYIPGYGYCTAQDTGAFRHEENGMKNQIDLFMETEKECRSWGRKRNVTIYILK
ncbi:MAG: G5 domain-containing protein [Clostridiales bacterium]|jgi:uncharacterized protein YabE (DUF348 family)|nr:G5 domain-containing protein [Clostridiales bacterium]